ncbi:DUF2190 family protein [Alkalicoccus chagannorensis]|uniref:DUF2190 family protein n=1 Tax=Alkalicoccus chagannorensis TaxID=427072 RepID=UPI00040AB09A|nr:DUF2190 family protein [Alkalicoccus chagannorensis]
MAKNKVYIQAEKLYLAVPEGTESGDPVVVGDLPAVAVTDADEDDKVSVDTTGAYKLAVTGAVEEGDALYFADGALSADDAEGASPHFGYALEAGEDEDITVKVGK